jgi:hypothetical protein
MKHKDYRTAFMNYGPVKANSSYRVLQYGYDYTILKVNGTPIHTPNFVLERQEKIRL